MLSGLTVEQSQRIECLLSDLLVRAEAEAIFLCNKGGYILANVAVERYAHNDNIAALAAGSFYATREIARLIGEPEFRSVFHQGDHKNLYMQNTPMDLLVVVVFGEQSNPGLVRFCANETCLMLDEELRNSGDGDLVQAALQAADISINADGQLFKVAAGR